jgi:hypothetical protein
LSQSCHFSNANSLRLMFAGILQAIIAASAKMYLNHTLDPRNHLVRQPESNKTPAANTSLIGAILVAVLYPRWCNEFPEVSSAETWSLSIWILILKSGCTLSMLGRCPVRKLIYYCILTFCETNSEWLKLSECTVASITKVWLALMYLDQFTPEIPLYKACSLVALKNK